MKTCFSEKYPTVPIKLIDNILVVKPASTRMMNDLDNCNFKVQGEFYKMNLHEFLLNLSEINKILKIEQAQLEDFTSATIPIKLSDHVDLNKIESKLKVPLMSFQRTNVNNALHYPWFLIGDQMGLGKSLQAIAIATISKKTVVVCPAFLKLNWQNEVKKFTNLTCTVIMSVRCLAKKSTDLNANILIVNYEILGKVTHLFENVDLVICDEFHKVCNPAASMSKNLFSILGKNRPERFIGLTGTAINNRVGEFYNLIRILSLSPYSNGIKLQQDRRYNVQYKFNQFFSFEKHNGYGTQFFGLRNYSELKKLLEQKYNRHTVEENLPDMPDIRRIEVDAGDYTQEFELKLSECFNRQQVDNKDNQNEYLATIKREAAEAKIPAAYRLLTELLEQGEKVVVFSDHRTPILELSEMFKKYNPSTVIGGISLELRQKAVENFQNGDAPLFLATIGSASTGITLTSSHICVFIDLPWVPAQLLQAEARIRRIGQTNRCVSYFIMKSKIDRVILNTIVSKTKILNTVLSSGKENEFKVEKSE